MYQIYFSENTRHERNFSHSQAQILVLLAPLTAAPTLHPPPSSHATLAWPDSKSANLQRSGPELVTRRPLGASILSDSALAKCPSTYF